MTLSAQSYEQGWLHPQLPHPPCHSGVTVVGELAECVHNGQLRVGGRQQGQSQGHSTADHWVPITELEGGRGEGGGGGVSS